MEGRQKPHPLSANLCATNCFAGSGKDLSKYFRILPTGQRYCCDENWFGNSFHFCNSSVYSTTAESRWRWPIFFDAKGIGVQSFPAQASISLHLDSSEIQCLKWTLVSHRRNTKPFLCILSTFLSIFTSSFTSLLQSANERSSVFALYLVESKGCHLNYYRLWKCSSGPLT